MSAASTTASTPAAVVPAVPRRERLQLRGLVQGVGFRPHVYRTAVSFGLSGWVKNDAQGVTLEVQGEGIDAFVKSLISDLPPLARVDRCERFVIPVLSQVLNGDSFQIITSTDSGKAGESSAAVPADAAICKTCIEELFTPDNRRYLHPFIACSDCGPRYTMSTALPYDRRNTTMSEHVLCDDCQGEYQNPLGRRLHAEPIACHSCGPRLSHSTAIVVDALKAGKIIALKGVGGFHLLCDARNTEAVRRLRQRKKRSLKPFAVMLLNAKSAAAEVFMSGLGYDELCSPRRPVIVADRQPLSSLPDALAPGMSTLGTMLPYTGIHYLLFWLLAGRPQGLQWLEAPSPVALLMTSANVSGDPILAAEDEASAALGGIADLVVTHDRRIASRCDDSVLRDVGSELVQLRRSRGYAPQALDLKRASADVLALGAHLKNTLCVLRGTQAHLTAHIGDLDSVATRDFQQESVHRLLGQLDCRPIAIACDLHPDYASTRLAEVLSAELDVPLLRVQHHHAHAASVLALENWTEPALALTLDGHGMGADGESWGGECLRLDGHHMKRVSQLRSLPTPGGDRAAAQPWRMAVGALAMLGRGAEATRHFPDEPMLDAVTTLAGEALCPSSTSLGRLFDAAAGLLGVCRHASFEAEAPMRLESLVKSVEVLEQGFCIDDSGCLDFTPLLSVLADGVPAERGAALFHGTLIGGLEDWVLHHAASEGLNCIALSGGCFANRWLSRELPLRLRRQGLEVLTGWHRLPPGDGGLSLGQAHVASLKYAQC